MEDGDQNEKNPFNGDSFACQYRVKVTGEMSGDGKSITVSKIDAAGARTPKG